MLLNHHASMLLSVSFIFNVVISKIELGLSDLHATSLTLLPDERAWLHWRKRDGA